MMRKLIIGIVVVMIIAGAAYALWGSGVINAAKQKEAQSAAPTLAAVKASNKVIADGKVIPVRHVDLSLSIGGIAARVPIAEGDHVEAGQTLVELDTRSLNLQLAEAEANLAQAQAKLNELKNSPTAADLAAAQQNLVAAQAAYGALLHPDQDTLAQLKAGVDKAKATIDRAQAAYDRIGGDSNPQAAMTQQREQLQMAYIDYETAQAAFDGKLHPTAAQVQQALAAITTAQSALDKLHPSVDVVAAAQATVDELRAARDLAQDNLDHARIVAPFAGVVVTLDVKPGEQVAPGTVLVHLADLSAWQIDTTNLTELNIVNVHDGSPALVSFDAIPGLELPGKVERIKALGENNQGDIVYQVTINPERLDARLLWNMTAKVSITPDRQE
jgi:HlyD family secretion protein